MAKYITLDNLSTFLSQLRDKWKATDNHYGCIKLGYELNNKNYPIALDENGRAYVNIPWESFNLEAATDTTLGGVKIGTALQINTNTGDSHYGKLSVKCDDSTISTNNDGELQYGKNITLNASGSGEDPTLNKDNFRQNGVYNFSINRTSTSNDGLPSYLTNCDCNLTILRNTNNNVIQILNVVNSDPQYSGTYLRTAIKSGNSWTWGEWSKYQINTKLRETNLDTISKLNVDGLYSGIILDNPEGKEDFFLIVVSNNEYVSQLKYSLINGKSQLQTRIKGSTGAWSAWNNIAGGGGEIPVAGKNILGGVQLGYTEIGDKYALQLNLNNEAFVEVPWKNFLVEHKQITGPTTIDLKRNTYLNIYRNALTRYLVQGTYEVKLPTSSDGVNYDRLATFGLVFEVGEGITTKFKWDSKILWADASTPNYPNKNGQLDSGVYEIIISETPSYTFKTSDGSQKTIESVYLATWAKYKSV